jgi:glutamine amidotransferase-like uncharacterized protein
MGPLQNKVIRHPSLFILSIFIMATILLSSCLLPETLNDNFEDDPQLSEPDNAALPNEPDVEEPLITNPSEQIKTIKVAIYNGVGSWDLNIKALENFFSFYGIKYQLIDENDITSDLLKEHFDLIWIPGGFAAEYKYFISDHGPLRDFVTSGGLFVGSCAGAYYAADTLRWLGEDLDYPLAIFNGISIGPLVNEINWGEEANIFLNQEYALNESYPDNMLFYYFDGPYFIFDDESEIAVLARYAINNEPAVITGHYGDGKYLLLGPHPEIGGYSEEYEDYDIYGGNNAQWSWLFSLLSWYIYWQ